MKNALVKDTLREIWHTRSRFLSIFLIVLLGCGFFSGVKATMPDMIETGNNYFLENRLMDLKLVSTIGVQSEDVEAVKKAEHVKGAHASYSKDVFYSYGNENVVLKCLSFNATLDESSPNLMNKLTVIEGRLPENDGECAVEVKMSSPDTFKIGEKLTFIEPLEGKVLTDTLANETYEIVGIVVSPMYIGYERDATQVGDGTIVSNVFLKEEEFVCSYYTEMFVDLDIDDTLDPFSDEYRKLAEDYSEDAVQVFTDSVNGRFQTIKENAQSKIEKARETADLLDDYITLDLDSLKAEKKKAHKLYLKYNEIYEADKDAGGTKALLERSAMLQAKRADDIIGELIADGTDMNGAAHEKYKAQLEEAQAEIEKSAEQLGDQAEPKIYSFNRFTASNDYSSFEGDSRKIDSISKVFPVFFILVAGLVCLTTMSRMIEEQRGMIGIYKALGYSSKAVAGKYLVYSGTAAFFGSIIGSIIGLNIFPNIIYKCYKMLYNIPTLETPVRWDYVFACCGVSVVCTCSVVLHTVLKELKTEPSALMRPKPPRAGKRVFIERFGFWGKLSFLTKVTLRNLFRYKRRFFMTLIGVVGCTALIVTGFGLKHSIKTIVDKQFSEVLLYDGLAVLNSNFAEEELDSKLGSFGEISDFERVLLSDGTAESASGSQDINIVVPSETERIGDFIGIRSTGDGSVMKPDDNSVIVTAKLASLLDIKAGDTLTVVNSEGERADFKVGGISVNYTLHYVFITPDLYERSYGKAAECNIALLKFSEGADIDAFKEKFTGTEEFYGLSSADDLSRGFLNSIDSLDGVVVLLIVCAGLLAGVVLYNLANINITERLREIATVKVLGFFDRETSDYILRENYISAVIGILLGFAVGKVLHRFVVLTSEVDVVMFNRELVWWAYLFGGLITFGFTLIVNLILHNKLKKVDMVESLKSVE